MWSRGRLRHSVSSASCANANANIISPTVALGVNASHRAQLAVTSKCKSCGQAMNNSWRADTVIAQLREFSLCPSFWTAAYSKQSPCSVERTWNDVASLSNVCDHRKPTSPARLAWASWHLRQHSRSPQMASAWVQNAAQSNAHHFD